jgi:hypothetical protein
MQTHRLLHRQKSTSDNYDRCKTSLNIYEIICREKVLSSIRKTKSENLIYYYYTKLSAGSSCIIFNKNQKRNLKIMYI